jgi:hypothetical protein
MIAKIATGEIEGGITDDGKNAAAVALRRMGGKARAKGMTAKKRNEIAKRAAKARSRKTPVPAEQGQPWHHRVPLGMVFFPSLEYALG